jgi:ABC-type uncharacterized transport system auxiliary subunit
MKPLLSLISIATAATLLGSCVSVNRLDEYRFEGATMSPAIYAPAYAEVHLSRGSIPGSEDSILLSLVEVGANVAVGLQEQKLEMRLNRIVTGDDLALALETEFVPEAASMLGVMTVEGRSSADYMLELEVDEYGLSSSGGIYMDIQVDARIIHRFSGETVWRRRFSVREPASPTLFGLNNYVETAVSVAALEQLSDDDLERGFELLGEQAARTLSEKFRRDLWDARQR